MLPGLALLWLGSAQAQTPCIPPVGLQAEILRNPSASAHAALGYWYIEQRNISCAIPAFRAAVKLDPNSFEGRYNLGIALAETGDLAGAAGQLRAAVKLRPGDSNAQGALREVERSTVDEATRHFNQSVQLLQANRKTEAIAELKTAIRLRPDYAEALGNLGVVYQGQGRAGEAEKLFRSAVKASPRDARHSMNLGLALADLKRYTEALEALGQALELAPGNTAVLSAKGMVLMRQQQVEQAIAIFRQVSAAEPASAQAHLNLGIALADAERQAEALPSLSEAVRLAPAMAQAHLSRGRALYDLKRYEEARTELETARHLNPADRQAAFRLGLTEARLDRPARAVELLSGVVAAEPNNGLAHQELGQALLLLGREDGVKHLRTALLLDPSNSQAAYALLRALSERGSTEAVQLGQKVREIKKEELAATQARAQSNFALDAAKEKQWPKAVEGMRKAVELCGTCPIQAPLRRNLGLILAQSGDIRGAESELQAARKLDPADKDVLYALQVLEKMKAKP